jgi:ferric-chelate reductase
MLCLYFRWQLKYFRVATRFGLLTDFCLALLLLPILRGLAIFRLVGIQFEASVRYHTWVGTAMLLFATLHGAITLFIWGVSHHIQDEVIHTQFYLPR